MGNPFRHQVEESAQALFNEVSVFFAGMTRAIQQTINPTTGLPYSIYNYNALSGIISGSGLFVHVQEEDVSHESHSTGVDFSKELIETLIGMATDPSELVFASAMIASVRKEGLRIATTSSETDSKAGSIIFVCEYLLGMPLVSAIVVYADCHENAQQIKVGPCFQESSVTTEWKLHKETYFFVPPSFIKKYAGDLDSVNSDPQYIEMINWMQGLVLRKPQMFQVVTEDNKPVSSGTKLTSQTTYVITGQFFPTDPKPSLRFTSQGGADLTSGASFGPDTITFTISASETQAELSAIGLYPDASSTTPIVVTPGSFNIESPAQGSPSINGDGIYDGNTLVTDKSTLSETAQYTIKGQNLSSIKHVKFFGSSDWFPDTDFVSGSTEIKFKVGSSIHQTTDAAIGIYVNKTDQNPQAETTRTYKTP